MTISIPLGVEDWQRIIDALKQDGGDDRLVDYLEMSLHEMLDDIDSAGSAT